MKSLSSYAENVLSAMLFGAGIVVLALRGTEVTWHILGRSAGMGTMLQMSGYYVPPVTPFRTPTGHQG